MINQLFSNFRLLSLDVVLGACVSTLFIAKCLDVTLPIYVVIALGIAVWIIYTADHLLDGSKSTVTPLTDRHQFHQKHRRSILIFLIFMILLGLILLFQLPTQIVLNGLVLVGGVIVYFIGLKIIGSRPSIYKEPLVALAYAIGVFLGPVSLLPIIDYKNVVLFFVIYVMMAFINLLIFSVYELTIDEEDQYTSLVRYIGKKRATYLITICFVALLLLWCYQLSIIGVFNMSIIILLLMVVALAAVNYLKTLFGTNEWYRTVGDAVFYFPLIALL